MIKRIEEMPAGTVGLRANGKLGKEDYRAVLEPALAEGVAFGEPMFTATAQPPIGVSGLPGAMFEQFCAAGWPTKRAESQGRAVASQGAAVSMWARASYWWY